MPVSRGCMRAQYPLLMALAPHVFYNSHSGGPAHGTHAATVSTASWGPKRVTRQTPTPAAAVVLLKTELSTAYSYVLSPFTAVAFFIESVAFSISLETASCLSPGCSCL